MEVQRNGDTDPFEQLLQATANVLAQLEKGEAAAKAKAQGLGLQIPKVRRALAALQGQTPAATGRKRKRKLTEQDVTSIRLNSNNGYSTHEIAQHLGIAQSTVARVLRGAA